MDLFLGALITGVAVGLLYGLLAFSIVLLHKFTGVANFAQGSLATLCTFVVYAFFHSAGLPLGWSIVLSVVAAVAIGALVYFVFMRPADHASHLNITIRTLGVYLLLAAVLDIVWSKGQPFNFPSVFDRAALFKVGSAAVSGLTIGTFFVAMAMAVIFAVFFNRSKYGLLFRAMAERPETARLLGVPTRRLTAISWVIATVVALPVGVLIAPSALLSTDMMDRYLLLAFSAAIIGGLDSLLGAYVGGLLVGIAYSVASVYLSADSSLLIIFAVLILSLLARPAGLFGSPVRERL